MSTHVPELPVPSRTGWSPGGGFPIPGLTGFFQKPSIPLSVVGIKYPPGFIEAIKKEEEPGGPPVEPALRQRAVDAITKHFFLTDPKYDEYADEKFDYEGEYRAKTYNRAQLETLTYIDTETGSRVVTEYLQELINQAYNKGKQQGWKPATDQRTPEQIIVDAVKDYRDAGGITSPYGPQGGIQTPWRGSQPEIVHIVRNALNLNRAEDDKLTDADVRARIVIIPSKEPIPQGEGTPRDGWTYRMKSEAELQAAGLATGKLTVEDHPDLKGQLVVRSDGYFVQTIPKPPNITNIDDVTVTEVDSGGDYKTVFLTNDKTGESLGSFRYEDKDPFKLPPTTETVQGVGEFLETAEGQFERQFTVKPIQIGNEWFYQANRAILLP